MTFAIWAKRLSALLLLCRREWMSLLILSGLLTGAVVIRPSALIAVAAIGSMTSLGGRFGNIFNKVSNNMK